MRACVQCGEENAIVEDSENGRTFSVCSECGSVVKEEQILTDAVNFEGTTQTHGLGQVSFNAPNSLKRKHYEPQGRKDGHKLIEECGLGLNYRPDMIQTAICFFNHLYEFIKHSAFEMKTTAAHCSLYVVGRQNGIPVTIRDFKSQQGERKRIHNFFSCLEMLKTDFNITIPNIELEEQTTSILSQAKLSSNIICLTQRILDVAKTAWIDSGRNPRAVIIAAASFAWKADNYLNANESLLTFCRQYKFECGPNVKKRYREIHNLLLTLMKRIPWITSKKVVRITNIPFYIEDILKYHRSLMVTVSQTSYSAVEEKIGDAKAEAKKENDFLPPSMKRVKKERNEILTDPIINTDHIDENEIDQYLRTDTEVKELQKYLSLQESKNGHLDTKL
ncbi:hypothetical protein CHS0354_035157 [Potamilus streckersoni]|uniref:Transcription factor IIIB 50 kDa subunit n=1 Tax=Potamilus streckersoni TaxID=2493646 RepID=A0AAE0TF10_9BIVA|nr:hypothetical protein CHS0354_035157 [Potamilus streckersoni]